MWICCQVSHLGPPTLHRKPYGVLWGWNIWWGLLRWGTHFYTDQYWLNVNVRTSEREDSLQYQHNQVCCRKVNWEHRPIFHTTLYIFSQSVTITLKRLQETGSLYNYLQSCYHGSTVISVYLVCFFPNIYLMNHIFGKFSQFGSGEASFTCLAYWPCPSFRTLLEIQEVVFPIIVSMATTPHRVPAGSHCWFVVCFE